MDVGGWGRKGRSAEARHELIDFTAVREEKVRSEGQGDLPSSFAASPKRSRICFLDSKTCEGGRKQPRGRRRGR